MTCAVCDRPVLARGYCGRHYQKFLRYGNPHEPSHRGENLFTARGSANPNYRGNEIGYAAAHRRVEIAKGKAAAHACVDCGRPAATWSYNRADLDEMHCAERNGAPYSVDVDCYEARCRSCHTKADHPTNRRKRDVIQAVLQTSKKAG